MFISRLTVCENLKDKKMQNCQKWGAGAWADMRWALARGDMVCSRVDLFLRDYVIAFMSINIAHWVIFVIFLLVDKPRVCDNVLFNAEVGVKNDIIIHS